MKTFAIEIVSSKRKSLWYANFIGNAFLCDNEDSDSYRVKKDEINEDSIYFVFKEDAKKLTIR